MDILKCDRTYITVKFFVCLLFFFMGGGSQSWGYKVGVFGSTGFIINFGGYHFDESKPFNKNQFSLFSKTESKQKSQVAIAKR